MAIIGYRCQSLEDYRLFTFVHHYAYREVSCGMLPKVCKARINSLKLLCFLHYLLTVRSYIFTRCSQGGKVTFGNTLCTFKVGPGWPSRRAWVALYSQATECIVGPLRLWPANSYTLNVANSAQSGERCKSQGVVGVEHLIPSQA